MQYWALICAGIKPADLESADMAHFAAEASESQESGAFTPERARGLTFLLLFSEAPIGADLLWAQGLLRRGSPMQMKSVASCLLDFKDSQAHDAVVEGGKKVWVSSCCSFMDTVVFLSCILNLIWTHNYSIFPVMVVFLERLLNRWPHITLNS